MNLKSNERTEKTVAFLMNVFLILVLSMMFSFAWNRFYSRYVYYFYRGNIAYYLINAILLILFNWMYGGFNIGYSTTGDLVFSQIISLLFTNIIIFFQVMLGTKKVLPSGPLWGLIGIECAAVILLNFLFNRIYFGIFPPKATLLVYEEEDPSIYERINAYQKNSYDVQKKERYETFAQHSEILDQFQCVIGVGLNELQKESLAKNCYQRGKSFYLVPNVYDVIVNAGKSVYLVDTPVFKINNFGPSQISKLVKRIWDILFSVVFLVITSPIMAVTALAIKLEDHGPVFYKQTRLTQYGRTFKIIKFRSMKVDAEKDGVARFAAEDDDRITKVGHFIRSCRIDELPQLFNILKGDMSVVGPRPERPEIQQEILKTVPDFNLRLGVKAGLTGYAQVYGKYNTRLKDKLLFDLIYIENFSILLDIRIMFMTFKILFKKDSTEGVKEQ